MIRERIQEVQYHEDDRAQRLLDVFSLTHCQLNISYVNSTNHVVAWHRHEVQTDWWICLKGSFKVGLKTIDLETVHTRAEGEPQPNSSVRWHYLSDKNFRILRIPPGIWHGYKALEPNSILMYCTDQKYDPNDELRCKVGSFGESWGKENK